MTIEANIAARKAAHTIHDLARDEAFNHQGQAAVHFWESLNGLVADVLPVTPAKTAPIPAMTDAEARQFGQTTMPFGKHSGQRVDEVPIDYLEWLDEQPDFRRDLNRYLRSERVSEESNAPGPPDGW